MSKKVNKKNNKKITLVRLIAIVLALILMVTILYVIIRMKADEIEFHITGEEEITIEYGSEYTEYGYVAKLEDKSLSKYVDVVSNVDVNKVGDYTVSYILKIKYMGVDKKIDRKVHVVDTVSPELVVDGNKSVKINLYENYKYPSYSSIDNVDGDITDKVQVESNLNTSKEGKYEIKYTSVDSSNNVSTDKIVVTVERKYKHAYVKVSINKQKLEYYENNKLVLTSDVVTGINNKTPTGTFKVIEKQRNVTLKGADYSSFVNYWISFKSKYGFHDASWRSKFGGTIYKTNGSHGCVNMPYNKVKQLYQLVEIGTPVYISY